MGRDGFAMEGRAATLRTTKEARGAQMPLDAAS